MDEKRWMATSVTNCLIFFQQITDSIFLFHIATGQRERDIAEQCSANKNLFDFRKPFFTTAAVLSKSNESASTKFPFSFHERRNSIFSVHLDTFTSLPERNEHCTRIRGSVGRAETWFQIFLS